MIHTFYFKEDENKAIHYALNTTVSLYNTEQCIQSFEAQDLLKYIAFRLSNKDVAKYLSSDDLNAMIEILKSYCTQSDLDEETKVLLILAIKIAFYFHKAPDASLLLDYVKNEKEKLQKINIPLEKFDNATSQASLSELAILFNHEFWRLYVDGFQQNTGASWEDYEAREPNCIKQMHSAFLYALTSSTKLSAAIIDSIHRIALENVSHVSSGRRMPDASYTVINAFSLAGILESIALPASILKKSDFYFIRTFPFVKYFNSCFYEIFDSAIEALKETGNTNQEKFMAIVKFCTDQVRWHPYKDGNCRTFSIILLNSLLIHYGFSPSIMYNPNSLEGYITYEEAAQEVLNGIQNFRELISTYGNSSSMPSWHSVSEFTEHYRSPVLFQYDALSGASSSQSDVKASCSFKYK